jgi:hypothetical protein
MTKEEKILAAFEARAAEIIEGYRRQTERHEAEAATLEQSLQVANTRREQAAARDPFSKGLDHHLIMTGQIEEPDYNVSVFGSTQPQETPPPEEGNSPLSNISKSAIGRPMKQPEQKKLGFIEAELLEHLRNGGR